MPKLSQMQELWNEIERRFGGSEICYRCGATVHNFADVCDAEIDDPCPGFMRYDEIRTAIMREMGLV